MAGAIFRGDAKLDANLRRMSSGPSVAQIKSVGRAALSPMQAAVIDKAPRPALKRTTIIADMGSTGNKSRTFWLSFYGIGRRVAHLVEFGTAPHSLHKGASRRKNIMQDKPPFHPGTPPIPFMRPAFEQEKGNVIRLAGELFWSLITKDVR